LRQRARFEISPSMQQKLDDPEVNLTHRSKAVLKLSDIFVFPDLQESLAGKDLSTIVRGDHMPDLVAKSSYLLITGDTQSGKTSLVKMLFRRLHEAGNIPILLSGDMRFPSGDRLFGKLEEVFAEQYDPEALEIYRQIDRDRRVIIIDDYHKMLLGKPKKQQILSGLAKFAGKLILVGHDVVLVEGLTNPAAHSAGDLPFSHYRIRPFGFARRSLLVERWLMLDSDADSDSSTFAHQLIAITRHLDTIIGKNFVPAYPVYILSVLQASEAATPIDLRASTHGYFYELFIRTALARGKSRIEFDLITSYLAFLAYNFYVEQLRLVDKSTLERFHRAYEDKYDIKRAYEDMRDELVGQHMLEESINQYKFKYPYVYYYFVAGYMRDHISEPEIQMYITEMSHTLYVEENANILLFLVHLSKDPIIIEKMQNAADSLYNELTPANFEDDATFLAKLEEVSDEFVYRERDAKDTRREMFEALDQDDQRLSERIESEEKIDPARAQLDPLVQINVALKTLQILGQILKNFPGSVEAPTKLKIARSCVDLGLRANSSVFKLVGDNQDDIVRDLVEIARERYPNYANEDLQRRARKTIVGMAHLVSYGLVKHVSHAIGSPDLTATYDKLVEEQKTASRKLIRASILLDHTEEVGSPFVHIRELAKVLEGNFFGIWVLRMATLYRFHLFPASFSEKQRTCEALGISYSKMQAADPEIKLIDHKKEK